MGEAMHIFGMAGRAKDLERQLKESRNRLYRVAYSWCHNRSLSEDLVQETLSKALRNSAQLRDPGTLNSWLFSILTNCWRDHFRQHKDIDDIDEVHESLLANERTPEDECAQAQIVLRVRTAIASLPLAQRQVVTLVDLEEFSYAEVAGILAVPVGTVMSRLSRARQTLKAALLEPPQKARVIAESKITRLR
jgi:RNA polymerase sigma-70 factor (ECF subfamily)